MMLDDGRGVFAISLSDLAGSGLLTASHLVLADDDAGSAPQSHSSADERLRFQLNAAKLCLVLSRATAGLICEAEREANRADNAASILGARNITVHFSGDGYSDVFSNVPAAYGLHEARIAPDPGGSTNVAEGQMQTPHQKLGMIIRSVYPGGCEEFQSVSTPRLVSQSSPEVSGVSGRRLSVSSISLDGSSSRVSKSNRSLGNDESALFEQFRETGHFTTSMARLIADLLDGRCSSIEEVLRELKDMVSTPELYLFDPGVEFCSNLCFGKRHYGQAKETRRVLEVASRTTMPQLARVDADTGSIWSGASSDSNAGKVDAIFIRGMAGSGKSSLVSYAGRFLSSLDSSWVYVSAKFKRGADNEYHESQKIACGLFDELIKKIASMDRDCENGILKDIEYSRQVASAILTTFDGVALAILCEILPGLKELIPHIDASGRTDALPADENMSSLRLIFLLSRLTVAVLSVGRNIFLVLDDIQWCDNSTLEVMSEVFISVGQQMEGGQKLIYAGVYRDDEVGLDHPVSVQIDTFNQSQSVYVADQIEITYLARDEVADMLMAEMRLPHRKICKLADVVYRRTLGHAMFVVQLLNALVSSGIISYSPLKHCYSWDADKLAKVKTFDSVASLIASNVSNLDEQSQKALRVLSCLLGQADLSLLRLLESNEKIAPVSGFDVYLKDLIDRGIIEISEEFVSFTHDLILQQVYDNIPHDERLQMHFDIGTYLGNVLKLDDHESTLESIMRDLDLESNTTSNDTDHFGADLTQQLCSIIFVAVDQVNLAGSRFVKDNSDLLMFAEWNKVAADEAAKHSCFQIAANLYKCGIDFLHVDQDAWKAGNVELYQGLHEGAAKSLFTLGKYSQSIDCANAVIRNMEFEQSVRAYPFLMRSLNSMSRFSDTIATGIAVFRTIGIDVPKAPTPETLYAKMKQTSELLGKYDIKEILDMSKKKETTDTRTQDLRMINDHLSFACYRQASPYLPHLACSVIQFAIEQNVPAAHFSGFLVPYGNFLLTISEDFAGAKKVAELCGQLDVSRFTRMTLYGFLYLWFLPYKEIAQIQHEIYEDGMKVGDFDSATFAECLYYRFAFFAGCEKLQVLTKGCMRNCRDEFTKYNVEVLRFAVIDILLFDTLTGRNSNPLATSNRPEFKSESSLLAYWKSKKLQQSLVIIHINHFMRSFWRGEYKEAKTHYELAEELPSFRIPKVQLLHSVFYHGIVLFQLHRDGEGGEYFEKGKAVMELMRRWEPNCKHTFESKLVLLEAECKSENLLTVTEINLTHSCQDYASNCNIVASKESYELSAKIALENGLVHERGLAFELYGKFLKSIVEIDDALKYLGMACDCYTVWGAHAKVSWLVKEHNLVLNTKNRKTEDAIGTKHLRSREE